LESKQNKALQFLFIGRVSKDKGVNILIDVFKAFDSKDVHLHIVGSGELYTNKKYKAITFYGFKTNLEQYYLLADYFISLPLMENCPFSTLDALSYGVPVITTQVGGLNEIIRDGYNGFLVKRNIKDVSELINNLVVNNNQHEIMIKNALKTTSVRFNINDVIDKYKQVIESL
jgi:glycosyltransferase involved in cell wall biosynthesis